MPIEPTYNEQQLLLRISEGDENAFRTLLYQWQPFLTNHIFRITESRELTEEIVQDVFLKIWLTRETLQAIDNFKAYLVIISRNHALNAITRMARELKNRADFIQGTQLNEEATETIEAFQLSLLDEAVSCLPERQKEVYLLHRHERLSYVEIGQKLGIGRETVKTHLNAAVRNITQHVKSRLSLLALLFELFK